MQRSWKVGLSVAAVAALAVGLGIGRGCTAQTPFAGSWKVVAIQNVSELTLAILKIEEKDGKPQASIVAGLQGFDKATVENVKADARALRFTLKVGRDLEAVAYAPGMGAKVDRALGSLLVGKQYLPLILEKTDATELDPKKGSTQVEGAADVIKAIRETDEKKRVATLKEILEKNGDKPIALVIGPPLLDAEVKADAGTEELSGTATRYLKSAAPYGPEYENQALLQAAKILARSDKGAPVAVDLAGRVLKQIGDNAPAGQAVPVLKILVAGLKKTGKTNEARPLEERLAKLEDQLDQEFIKTAVPFKPRTFAGRTGKSERVSVVELFTGAQCPPCVSADIAFDAALKAYKPADVVFLQYHLHIPGPDPLTNPDSEARAKYYGDQIEGTPTMFLDGKATAPMGGFAQHGEERFEALRKLINERLETDAEAKLTLKADRQGDTIKLHAEAADLKKTGEKVRLRFVLVEDVARYAGTNGQRLHHHVVRAFPGGVEGFALKDKTAKQDASMDLTGLGKSLNDYLSKPTNRGPYLDDDRPLDLKHLKAIALIQDDDSKEILQATQVDIPEAK
jgi:hypothetical protein